MALGIRGANPIWLLDDLTGHLFDDTFYMYVLENTIPYIPANAYHDPDLSLPWTQPIQFLANGTLPIDIFFTPDTVYRLEFRQNNGIDAPSQSDPLIYEVNDYIAGTGGSTPVDTLAFATSNQVTNPQFSLISFSSPFSLSGATDPDPLEIAPGWFLDVAGTGSVTATQVPLNNLTKNPSNAPYALRLTLSGWTTDSVFLRQRFQQNGMLWANKYVSSTLTAAISSSSVSSGPLNATLVDSNDVLLTNVLTVPTVIQDFVEYTGNGFIGDTTNPDLPPVAYIDYKLALPSNIDIYLTSIQLVAQDLPLEPAFEQDSIERQIDHTFHYYRDSLLFQPKESLLAGWNFSLNPWQFKTTAQTNVGAFGYTADQTIIVQQAYVASTTTNNISVGRATAALNYGFKVQAVTATNQFAIIQYIDPTTIRPYWGEMLSSMIKLVAQKQTAVANIRMKMRLIWRTSLPPTLAQFEPIDSWTALGEPVFAAGWTAITSLNDPVYNLSNGANTLLFESFELPASSADTMSLGIVVYTIDPMVQSGTPDYIIFDRISLVQNEFAIDCNIQTYDESFAQCQYYYQKSFPISTVPAQNAGLTSASLGIQVSGAAGAGAFGPIVRFRQYMRDIPAITRFNPSAANNQIRDLATGTDWSASSATDITAQGFVAIGTTPGGSSAGNGSAIHWVADARLGS